MLEGYDYINPSASKYILANVGKDLVVAALAEF